MLRASEVYYICIVKPLEIQCFELKDKMDNNKLWDIFFWSANKKLYEQCEQSLFEAYGMLNQMIKSEMQLNRGLIRSSELIR